MHLSILIENMRRGGYEFQVGAPKVLYKEIDGVKCEPVEKLVVDVPEDKTGTVFSSMGERKGELLQMENLGSRIRLEFAVPARGLFGYKSQFLTDTRGEGVFNTVFLEYQPYKGDIVRRQTGSLVAFETARPLLTDCSTRRAGESCLSVPERPSMRAWSWANRPRRRIFPSTCARKNT